jgi:hypothetical protein
MALATKDKLRNGNSGNGNSARNGFPEMGTSRNGVFKLTSPELALNTAGELNGGMRERSHHITGFWFQVCPRGHDGRTGIGIPERKGL